MNAGCEFEPVELLRELVRRYSKLDECEDSILEAYDLLVSCYANSGKLLVCGNGGSAADCEHIVGELMKSFMFKRKISDEFAKRYRRVNGHDAPEWLEGVLPAISLVSQTAFSSAFGNDEAAVGVYAQQVYGYGAEGDALLGISTSGSSANVIEAARVARALGMKVIALTGHRESALSGLSDVAIRVPETDTFKVQEYHLPVYHCLCAMVEARMHGGYR